MRGRAGGLPGELMRVVMRDQEQKADDGRWAGGFTWRTEGCYEGPGAAD